MNLNIVLNVNDHEICHKTRSLKIPNVEIDVSVSVDKMQLLTHTSKIQNEYLPMS